MRNTTRLMATLVGISWATLACAGATPPAQPATAAQPGSAEKPQAAAAATPPPAKAAEPEQLAPSKETPSEERDGLRKASRPPIDLLTGNNVVYVFNFAGSAKGEAAKAQCESQGEQAQVRECLANERSKIPVESVRFVKDAHGQYWWVAYNRYKGNLLKWHKVQFLPGKADDDTISLSLVGKDKGIAPMARVPASLKVELPNDYSIVISDPELGQMLYDAKIGLMDVD